MKNTNLLNLQNGLSILIAAKLTKAGKAAEYTVGDYMFKGTDGLYYIDAAAWCQDNRPSETSYKKTIYYIMVPCRCLYSYMPNGYNAADSDGYAILYFYSYYRSWPTQSSAATYLNFTSAIWLVFPSYDNARKCLTSGCTDEVTYCISKTIDCKNGDMTSGNRIFINWYNDDGTIKYENDIMPYWSNYAIPNFSKRDGGYGNLPARPYTK